MSSASTLTDVWTDQGSYAEIDAGSLTPRGLYASLERTLEKEWAQRQDDLIAIRALSENWTGEDAIVPPPELIDSAIDLLNILHEKNELPPPSRVVASPLGTAIIEWQHMDLYLEAEISEPYFAEFMLEKHDATFEHIEYIWEPAIDAVENVLGFERENYITLEAA